MALIKTISSIIFALTFIGVANAKDPILFGPEFTFSSVKMLVGENDLAKWGETSQSVLKKYADWLEVRCKKSGCLVKRYMDGRKVYKIDVTFKDGFFFEAAMDMNVIEFSAKPLSAEDWGKTGAQAEEYIFSGMKEVGQEPKSYYGSGHINFDKKNAFGEDVRRMRDFFVDFYNHPALADGILEKDPYNAISLAQLGEKEKIAFADIVSRVDSGEIDTIHHFENEFQTKVLKGQTRPEKEVGRGMWKGYAIRIHPNRIEIRSARAQKSVREFQILSDLFSHRIKYLSDLRASGKPVALLPRVGANYAWQSLSQFYYYVTETGLDWKIVKELSLPARYQFYPGPLPRDIAFADRMPCVYWMKDIRKDLMYYISEKFNWHWFGDPTRF